MMREGCHVEPVVNWRYDLTHLCHYFRSSKFHLCTSCLFLQVVKIVLTGIIFLCTFSPHIPMGRVIDFWKTSFWHLREFCPINDSQVTCYLTSAHSLCPFPSQSFPSAVAISSVWESWCPRRVRWKLWTFATEHIQYTRNSVLRVFLTHDCQSRIPRSTHLLAAQPCTFRCGLRHTRSSSVARHILEFLGRAKVAAAGCRDLLSRVYASHYRINLKSNRKKFC